MGKHSHVSPNQNPGQRNGAAPTPRTSQPSQFNRPAPSHRMPQSQQGQHYHTRPAYQQPMQSGYNRPATHHAPITPAYARKAPNKKNPLLPLILALVLLGCVGFGVYHVLFASASCSVEDGREVTVVIPEGSSGDQIASILSDNHVIDNPKHYYAAVSDLQADMSIKPGKYHFKTHQDPKEVVEQLMAGSNIEFVKLTIPEGLTVKQTAQTVASTFDISADEFLNQAKASNYVDEFPFLEGAYNDSLEGFLYPKTYEFDPEDTPTADAIIRMMLNQFVAETSSLGLENGAQGLSMHEIISMASLIERETAQPDERPKVASVMYNRLDIEMYLQIDAAIAYILDSGNRGLTYEDLKVESPYNVYQHKGLVPGPICSPTVSSIEAAMNPADTDYLFYVVNSREGTHAFSNNEEQFMKDKEAYIAMSESWNEVNR